MKKHWIVLWMLAVSQLQAQAMAATIHKWTDAKGVVHYGGQMPIEAKDAKSLATQAKKPSESERAVVNKTESGVASQVVKYAPANKNLSARDIATCHTTYQTLQDVQQNNVMMQHGQQITLTPAERDRVISMSKEILTYCDRK